MKPSSCPVHAASHLLLRWLRTAALGVLTCSANVPVLGDALAPSPNPGRRDTSFPTLNGVSFLEGLYIAVGDDGTLLTRVPGGVWQQRVSGVEIRLNAVAYGAGWYVAVGDEGVILLSRDGIRWERCFAGIAENLKGILYARGRFVAVGAGGAIVVSRDAHRWEWRNSGVTTELRSIADDGGQLVVVGAYRTFLVSSDGDGWTKALPSACPGFYGVIPVREAFWIAGCDGLIRSVTEDGGAWSHGLISSLGPVFAVTGDDRGYVAAGPHGTLFTSPDGGLWRPCPWATSKPLWGLATGTDGFVAVGAGGVTLHSADGRTWKRTGIEWLPRSMAAVLPRDCRASAVRPRRQRASGWRASSDRRRATT